MRLPNGYGGISKLSGNRRKPFVPRITSTFTDERSTSLQESRIFCNKRRGICRTCKV